MNAREERDLLIAATHKLTQKGKVWLVPSQSGKGKYTALPDSETLYCSCPDFEETGLSCKHIHAVRFTVTREQAKDGTITETRTITLTRKKTYKQDWPADNLAQVEEKKRFLVLLRDLCRGLVDMYLYYQLHREEFMAVYHHRSNAESTFSAIKRKFGDSVRSKTEPATVNEVLAKIVCHNIACVIHAWYEMGIDPANFGMPKTEGEPEAPAILRFPGLQQNQGI
jgi:predicted nucleic acid-binding Zn finger protein